MTIWQADAPDLAGQAIRLLGDDGAVKASTMRPALTGPMALTSPLLRYFLMPWSVAGRAARQMDAVLAAAR